MFRRFIFLTFSCLLISSISFAQEDYKTLKARVLELEKAGDFIHAVPVAEKALQRAETEYGKDNYRYGAAMSKLAEMYRQAGMLQKAEQYFLLLLEMDKKKFSDTAMVVRESLNRLGRLYCDMALYDKAVPLFRQAAEITKKNQQFGSLLGNDLNNLASAQFEMADYNASEKTFLQAIGIFKDLKDTSALRSYSNCLNGLGVLYSVSKRFLESEKYELQSLEIKRKVYGEYSLDYAITLKNLGSLYKDMGRYIESEDAQLKALSIIKGFGENTLTYASSLHNLGVLYTHTGDFGTAENLIRKSLQIYKSISGDQVSTYSTGLNALANLYADMALYPAAEILYKQCLEITAKSLGTSHPYYAIELDNLATLYSQMGRYDLAEKNYKLALDILKKAYGENHPEYAMTLRDMGYNYQSMLKFDLSENYLNRSLSIIQQKFGEENPEYAKTIIILGNTYALNKKFNEGVDLYLKALKYYDTDQRKLNTNYLSFRQDLASMLMMNGDYLLAENNYKEVLELMKTRFGENHPGYTSTLMALGALYMYEDKLDLAEPLFKKMAENIIRQVKDVFPSMSEKEKAEFYGTVSFNFEVYNNFAIRWSKNDPSILSSMYNYQLFTKGLLVNSSIKIKQRILASNNQELIALYKSWLLKKEQLARYRKQTVQERKKEGIDLEKLEAEANEIEKNLSARSELFADARQSRNYSWLDVKNKLMPGEAAVEIIRFRKHNKFLTDTSYYAALIVKHHTVSQPALVLLENGNELEKKYLKYYTRSTKMSIRDTLSYPQYWSRIAAGLGDVKKIYFSPDGVYNQISINTLLNPATGKYVMDETDIHQVTNTSDILAFSPVKKQEINTASLFGYPNYELSRDGKNTNTAGANNVSEQRGSENVTQIRHLPGTKKEIETIEPILTKGRWKVKTYLYDEAVEEAVKSQQSPTLLHIATHGFFEPDFPKDSASIEDEEIRNPLFNSGIYLAGAQQSKNRQINADALPFQFDDGILTSYEVMNLNLDNTELVVLSACETGLGEIKNGEGVYGLQRAMKIAGANTIIISLWTVNDKATQLLMTTFYDNWMKTGNKREAFRAAQTALRGQFPAHYYWGPFIMVGE